MNLRFTLIGALLAGTLSAQEIHLGPPSWLALDDLPDELPVVRGVEPMPVSPEQKTVTEPTYLERRFSVSDKGVAISWASASTSPWFVQAFTAPSRSFIPAKRAGKSVASEIAVFYIYNPASASAALPDATPRLLVVRPPVYPENAPKVLTEEKSVRVRAELDENGAVTAVTALGTPAGGFASAAEAAVKTWEFAPARKAGHPVASALDLSVAFKSPAIYNRGEVMVQAKTIKQVDPIYPVALRRLGVSGRVDLVFTVTVEGRVADAIVVHSTHSAFEESCLRSLREWRFTPAAIDGRPVPMQAGQRFDFAVDDAQVEELKVTVPTTWPPNLPEALRFDVSPKLKHLVLPVYPVDDLLADRKGKVTLAYVVGPDGTVKEVTALPGAPSSTMAAAAVAALQEWTFTPPGQKGKPSHALLRIDLEFVPNGESGQVPVTAGTKRILKRMKTHGTTDFPVSAALDRQLTMRVGKEVMSASRPGEATVEFVVDRDGVAQLPRLISATDDATGYLAMQRVSRWRFSRPIFRGKLVDCLMRASVRFETAPAVSHR